MTGLTTWERWMAGLPPRGRDERARYREYDATAGAAHFPAAAPGRTQIDPALDPDRGPLQVLTSKPAPERSAA